jgi:hypothetical protein
VTLRTICRRGHAKEPSGRCKQCERLAYERLVAARRAEGLTARGRPRYSLRTHCLHGHPRSDNEVRRKTNGTRYCRVCNRESMRRHRQRSRLLIRERRIRPHKRRKSNRRFLPKPLSEQLFDHLVGDGE